MKATLGSSARASAWRLSLVTLLVFQQPASTAVIVVGGGCTLADAITAANADSAVGGCSTGSGADELQLTEHVTLTTALPTIASDITLDGGDFTVARDNAAPGFGIFSVLTSPFALRNTTVTNGLAANGGAVHANDSMVTITNSTLSGNQATASGGAIYSYGDFSSSDARTTVIDSSLLNNTAGRGGAIFNAYDSDSLVLNSTLSGNSASITGGGIYNAFYSLVSVTNSTVSGNSAVRGGGIYNALYSDTDLVNSTVSGNSGSNVYAGFKTGPAYSVTLDRSVVAYAVSGGNCGGYAYPFVGGVGNFDDDFSCPGTSPIAAGVDFDTTLADNGGPTQTHALLAGSVAIDAAGDCGLVADQRGMPRDDGACDSGSFELGAQVVGGSVGGMELREARCRNLTTSQSITFPLSGGSDWDCAAQGLTVSPGDQVRQSVAGRAVDGASASVLGLVGVVARCQNRTTGQTVPLPLSTTSWDCVAEGLVVNAGDRIEQQLGGTVP